MLSSNETFRVTLPSAKLYKDGNVGVREYPLKMFCKSPYNYMLIRSIHYAPAFANFEVHHRSGRGDGVYAGNNGNVSFTIGGDDFSPIDLYMYNLTLESDIQVTFELHGEVHGL